MHAPGEADVAESVDVGAMVAAHDHQFGGAGGLVRQDHIAMAQEEGHEIGGHRRQFRHAVEEGAGEVVHAGITEEFGQVRPQGGPALLARHDDTS